MRNITTDGQFDIKQQLINKDAAIIKRDIFGNPLFLADMKGVALPGVQGVTWDQFASLNPNDLHGKYIRITDVHSSLSGYGGSLFVADATGAGGWGQESPYLIYPSISLAPDPTAWPGLRILSTGDGDQKGMKYVSDGANYVSEEPGLLGLKCDSIYKLICPNAGITWTASDNGSGKVRLTASGLHGLTTNPAANAHLYSTVTQNGWVADSFHEISAIISTTVIDLTTNWVSQGVPIFALVGTGGVFYSLNIPVLLSNSYFEIDVCFTSSGLQAVNKNLFITLNNTYNIFNPIWNVAQQLAHPGLIVVQNAGNISVQRGCTISNNVSGGSAQAGIVSDGNINTGLGTVLRFGASPTVNEWVGLRRARIMLKR